MKLKQLKEQIKTALLSGRKVTADGFELTYSEKTDTIYINSNGHCIGLFWLSLNGMNAESIKFEGDNN